MRKKNYEFSEGETYSPVIIANLFLADKAICIHRFQVEKLLDPNDILEINIIIIKI